MLKLEKKSRDREIHIHMRAKQGFWNPTFRTALCIAVGLHLFAVILFHVSPFKLTNERILPPTAVEADIADQAEESEQMIVTQLDQDETKSTFTLNPRSTAPEVPKLPKSTFLREAVSFHEKNHDKIANSFESIENGFKEHYFIGRNSGKGNVTLPVQLNVSGQLAEKAEPEWSYSTLPRIPSSEPQRVVYGVQLDNKTGKIFYFIPKELSKNPHTQLIAESILRELTFSSDAPDEFVTSGEIEIVFNATQRFVP